MKIATWNTNAWQRSKATEPKVWALLEHLKIDLAILTEARLPLPKVAADSGWRCVGEPMPGKSGWGTAVVVRGDLILEEVLEVKEHKLEKKYGSVTVADLLDRDATVLCTIIGLYIPFRKNHSQQFIESPERDLRAMHKDFECLTRSREHILFAGDLNQLPSPRGLETFNLRDPWWADQYSVTTYEKPNREQQRLDYIFLTDALYRHVTGKQGGWADFPDARSISDHAPLVLELDFARDRTEKRCRCGVLLRLPRGSRAQVMKCPSCAETTRVPS